MANQKNVTRKRVRTKEAQHLTSTNPIQFKGGTKQYNEKTYIFKQPYHVYTIQHLNSKESTVADIVSHCARGSCVAASIALRFPMHSEGFSSTQRWTKACEDFQQSHWNMFECACNQFEFGTFWSQLNRLCSFCPCWYCQKCRLHITVGLYRGDDGGQTTRRHSSLQILKIQIDNYA